MAVVFYCWAQLAAPSGEASFEAPLECPVHAHLRIKGPSRTGTAEETADVKEMPDTMSIAEVKEMPDAMSIRYPSEASSPLTWTTSWQSDKQAADGVGPGVSSIQSPIPAELCNHPAQLHHPPPSTIDALPHLHLACHSVVADAVPGDGVAGRMWQPPTERVRLVDHTPSRVQRVPHHTYEPLELPHCNLPFLASTEGQYSVLGRSASVRVRAAARERKAEREALQEEPLAAALKPELNGAFVLERTEGSPDKFLEELGSGWLVRKLAQKFKYGAGYVALTICTSGDRVVLDKTFADPRLGVGRLELHVGGAPTSWVDDVGPCTVHPSWHVGGLRLDIISENGGKQMTMLTHLDGAGGLVQTWTLATGTCAKYIFRARI